MRTSALTLLTLAATAASAQAPAVPERVAEFKQVLAANQTARRQFTWLETSQIAYQGVVKTTKVSDCQYTASTAKPVCADLNLQQAPLSGGMMRRHIEEKKEGELKAYVDSVRILIAEYVPLQSALLDKAAQGGKVTVSGDPVAGTSKMMITNYRQAGDTVTIIVSGAKKVQWVKVSTWLSKPSAPVQLSVQFATLPNGVFYAYRKNLNAPSAGVAVTITTSDLAEAVKP